MKRAGRCRFCGREFTSRVTTVDGVQRVMDAPTCQQLRTDRETQLCEFESPADRSSRTLAMSFRSNPARYSRKVLRRR